MPKKIKLKRHIDVHMYRYNPNFSLEECTNQFVSLLFYYARFIPHDRLYQIIKDIKALIRFFHRDDDQPSQTTQNGLRQKSSNCDLPQIQWEIAK